MKTDSPLLPDGVADAWFHISCGGEVWTSRVCLGRNLLKVLDEIAPDAGHYAEALADQDSWYVVDGRCVSTSLPCGEDPDIEIALIDAPEFVRLVADSKRVDKLDALLKEDPFEFNIRWDNYNDSGVYIGAHEGNAGHSEQLSAGEEDEEDVGGLTLRAAIDSIKLPA